jgi:excisionase family DNA binding protein
MKTIDYRPGVARHVQDNDYHKQLRAPLRVTVAEACEILGISEGAVRQRIKRGTLRTEKLAGRVYVFLPEALLHGSRGTEQTRTPESGARTSEVEALREQVEWLRGEVQRKDAILLSMTEAMKALSAPEREPPETVEEAPEGAEPHPSTEEAQGGVQEPQRRRWWEFWR